MVVFTCSMAAFAYERLHFPAGEKIFWVLFFISLISVLRVDAAAV